MKGLLCDVAHNTNMKKGDLFMATTQVNVYQWIDNVKTQVGTVDATTWTDPVSGHEYTVPIGYDPYNTWEKFENADSSALLSYKAGDSCDLQRSNLDGTSIGGYVSDFQDIASFDYGVAAKSIGLSDSEALFGAGMHNEISSWFGNNVDTSGIYYNNPQNVPNIQNGMDYVNNSSYLTNAQPDFDSFSDLVRQLFSPVPNDNSSGGTTSGDSTGDPSGGSGSGTGNDGSSGGSGEGTGGGGGGGWGNDGDDSDKSLPPGIPETPPGVSDPLVLDLNGTGIALSSLNSSTAYVDFTGSGFAVHTGWITSGEGLLILDDGISSTTLTAANVLGAQSGNGFQDLAALDSNGDGVINASDTAFSQLKVWVDSGVDGQLATGELYSLADLGIQSINLSTTTSGTSVAGNKIISTATFVLSNPDPNGVTIHTIAEVDFATNYTQSIFTLPEGFTYSQEALTLPQLDGYGTMADLRVAMSLDPTLLTEVKNLVLNSGTMTRAEFSSAFEAIVEEWAGATTIDPTSRGAYVDARHLAVVYAFYGIDSTRDPSYAQNPNWHNGPTVWEPRYQSIIAELEARFVSQIGVASLLNGSSAESVMRNSYIPFACIQFNSATDRISVNLDTLVHALVNNAPRASTDASTYWEKILPILKDLKGDLFVNDSTDMAASFISSAERSAMPRNIEQQFLSSISVSWFDESSATGDISITSSNSVVFLGSGDKSIHGRSNDIYVYSASGGNDSITTTGSSSQLTLEGLATSDVTLGKTNLGMDLTITVKATGAILTLAGYFSGTPFEKINFSDDKSYAYQDVSDVVLINIARYAGDPSLSFDLRQTMLQQSGYASVVDGENLTGAVNGTAGNDVVILGDQGNSVSSVAGNDILVSGKGNDTLSGGTGSDSYVYTRGAGNDVIVEDTSGGSVDQLVFNGINASDVPLVRNGNNVTLEIAESSTGAGDGGSVLLQAELDDYFDQGVEKIIFADGTTWTRSDLRVKLLAQAATSGNDIITGFNVADTITGGAGDDTLNGAGGSDSYIYHAGDGNDTITEAATYDSTVDKLVLGTGLTPDKVVIARNGSDLTLSFTGQDGSIKLAGEDVGNGGGLEQIVFGDGTTWSKQDLEAAYIAQQEAAGATSITGFDQNNDVIVGTTGADSLSGQGGNDSLTGGLGDDSLNGGGGSDTYIYNIGDGNDTITEAATYDSTVDKLVLGTGLTPDKVVIARSGSDLTLSFTGQDGSIKLAGEDVGNGGGLEQIVFGDGTTWSKQDLEAAYIAQQEAAGATSITGFDQNNDVIVGTTGADILSGQGGNDSLTGGLGDDSLNGGGGSDTYIYNIGDGNDTITEAATYDSTVDKLVLGTGLTPDKVVIARNGSDLTLSFTGQDGSIKLAGEDVGNGGGLEQIVFGDGTTWSKQDLEAAYIAQQEAAGATSITGFDQNNDVIVGTTGADSLSGQGGNDTLTGGLGDDSLIGGGGSDTYIYNAGDGNDTITEVATYDSTVDRLVLGTGLTPDKVVIARNGSDLTLSFTGQDGSIKLAGEDVGNGGGLEQIVFGDGTTWSKQDLEAAYIAQQEAAGATSITGFDQNNDVIVGTTGADSLSGQGGNDTLTGGLGDDSLIGGGGSDTYIYNAGDGNDTITEVATYDSTVDRLELSGITPSAVSLVRNGNDVTLLITGSGSASSGSVLLKSELDSSYGQGVEQIIFADGTVWTASDLRTKLISAAGTSGNDTITGTNAADIIAGGLGDDSLNGGGGSDSYLYNAGDGNDSITEAATYDSTVDKLVLGTGLTPDKVVIARSGSDLTLSFAGQDGSIKLAGEDVGNGGGLEQIVFGNGTTWSKQNLEAAYISQQEAAGATSITGFDQNNDVLIGTTGADTLSGLGGNDSLTGGLGDDSLNGGGGSDSYLYNAGDGNDSITEAATYDSTVDKLVLGTGLTPDKVVIARSGSDLTLSFTGQDGSIKLAGEDVGNGGGLEQIVFGNGTTWSKQNLEAAYISQQEAAGATSITGFDQNNDVLIGTTGADTLSGLGGNDSLTGGLGDDSLNGGGGSDSYLYNAGDGNDSITEAATYDSTVDKLVLGTGLTPDKVVIARSGSDLTLSFTGQDGSIKLAGEDVGNGGGLEQIVFGNGTTWSKQNLEAAYISQQEAAGATSITGFDQNNDVLIGTTGADTLSGLGGNDSLTGSLGDDSLNGGGGSDSYLYNAGDGNDSITEAATYDSTVDKLVLGTGLTPDKVVIARSGSDLTLSFTGQDGSIKLAGEDVGNGGGLEQIVFGNGTTWSKQNLEAAYISQQEAAGATSITGFDQNNDVLIGTTGADTLSGLGGNDSLTGGLGDDSLNGGGGSDSYLYNAGDGNDSITEAATYDSTVDKLVLGTGLTPDKVVIARSGSDLTLSFTGQDGSIKLAGEDVGNGGGLEQIVFGNGTTWSKQNLEAAYISQQEAAGATSITGFDQNNDVLIGTTGADTLSGLGGNDSLTGGLGDDSLNGGGGSDSYLYNAGDGNDSITEAATYDSTVDKLVLGTGLTPDKVVIARSGSDLTLSFTGQDGSIKLAGEDVGNGGGLEQIVFGNGTTWSKQNLEAAYISQQEAAGATSITGFDQNNDVLIGTIGADTLSGLGGNDSLTGGLGMDTLTGGTGQDTFVYTSTEESPAGAMDTITDFSTSQGDRISLAAIDANAAVAGDQAFTYSGATSFTGVAGQLVYANGILSGDINGDGTADIQIKLTNNPTLSASSFAL